jgi:hypothetical protein
MSDNVKAMKDDANKQKSKDFSDLLNDISEIDDNLRALYIEIYTNAITDRTNAEVLLETLIGISCDNSTEHAVHGKTMASYIERMSRSNAQLMQLATIIADVKKREEQIDPESLFSQIRSKHNPQ